MAILLFFVIVITLGYSAFVDSLSVSNTVVKIRPQENTRISAVSTNSGYISDMDYTMTEIIGKVNIPNNASITLNTTITTYSNVRKALTQIKVYNGSNEITGLTISPNLSNTYIKICNNNDECTLNASKDIAITITNNTGSAITTSNFRVALTYTSFYYITYNDTVVGDVLSGNTFNYTVGNTITTVTKVSGNGTLDVTNLPNIEVSSITSDIVLTGSAGPVQDGSWLHPYLLDDATYHYSDLNAASYKFTELAGEPEITVDANHKVTKFEYTGIDSNGLTFSSGSSFNTGVLAFDGSSFTIHLEVYMTPSGNTGKHVIAAIAPAPNQNNKYAGFVFFVYSTSYFYINASTSANLNATSFGQQAGNWRINNGLQTFTWDFTYTPSPNKTATGRLTPVATNYSETPTINTSNFPTSLDNATIIIGGNGINTSKDIQNMVVRAFSVTLN